MRAVSKRAVSRGLAAALLALLPAYCSIDGLVTGETLTLAKRTHSYDGAAGIVTAISYGLFAAALLIAATRYFVTDKKRRAALYGWGWNVMVVAAVLFFAGRLMWVMQ